MPKILYRTRCQIFNKIRIKRRAVNTFCWFDPGVAGRGRPSWDGGGRRTVKDDGRKIFFDSVRLKDGFGRRTLRIFPQSGQAKFFRKRTEADAGRRRTKFVPRALRHTIHVHVNLSMTKIISNRDHIFSTWIIFHTGKYRTFESQFFIFSHWPNVNLFGQDVRRSTLVCIGGLAMISDYLIAS